MSELIVDRLSQENPLAILFDDLDEALVGIGGQFQTATSPLAIYSEAKIIECLVVGGMDTEGAREFYSHNIEGLWAGPQTPIILRSVANE